MRQIAFKLSHVYPAMFCYKEGRKVLNGTKDYEFASDSILYFSDCFQFDIFSVHTDN